MKSNIEDELLKMKPGPLPADLKQRLKSEPSIDSLAENQSSDFQIVDQSAKKRHPKRLWPSVVGALASAACLVVLFNLTKTEKLADPVLIGLVGENQTLVEAKILATEEYDGQLWELAEEKWHDETVVLCSATNQKVTSRETRRKFVLRPVEFY